MLRSILFATDGFERSSAAQQSAINLAKRFDAKITPFAVADTPMRITPEGKIEELSDGKRRAQAALQRIQTAAEAIGITIETRYYR
jgi:nucleotide-binding universal stress UspA family protein